MIKKARAFLIALLAWAWLAAPAVADGVVRGKVSFEGKGVGGVAALLYAVSGGRITGEPDYRSAPSAEDGTFTFSVKSGQYFLLVQRFADPSNPFAKSDLWSYYGGNPVVIGEGEELNVGLNATSVIPPSEPFKSGGTGIKGKVYADGAPLSRARVTLYQDATTIFRGIGYASVVTNDQGDFTFSLEPGEYYVLARKRTGDEKMGPLGEGDWFGFSYANPVRVEKDRFTLVTVNTAGKHVKVKQGGQDITLGGTIKSGNTTLSGTIVDKAGKPVAKVYAAAYRDSMMTQKPDFISAPTGEDGKYTITLSEGGEYFLGARNTLGGPAEKGDLLGRFAGNEDHVVKIVTGEKKSGLDITVEEVE